MASRITRTALGSPVVPAAAVPAAAVATSPPTTPNADLLATMEMPHVAETGRRARRPVVPGDPVGAGAGDAPVETQTSRSAVAPDAVLELIADDHAALMSDEVPATPAVAYVGDVTTRPAPPAPIDLTIYPAGSDTEDPSRGQPRLQVRPGKEVTGGFADQAALQYFALDGHELGILVQDMLASISDRIANDLRFNEAITYPRVGVRCWVEVNGFAEDQSFTVDKIMPDAVEAAAQGDPTIRATAIEIAREVADEIVFVIVAEKREADANGDPVDPPDKIRQELGLARPRKQMVRGPGNSSQMVDRLG